MSRRLFVVPSSWQTVSPLHDDRVAYEMGLDEADKQARIIAFGAIRRVAEVARKADRDADELYKQGAYDTGSHAASEALGIRRAIRIAIAELDDE